MRVRNRLVNCDARPFNSARRRDSDAQVRTAGVESTAREVRQRLETFNRL